MPYHQYDAVAKRYRDCGRGVARAYQRNVKAGSHLGRRGIGM